MERQVIDLRAKPLRSWGTLDWTIPKLFQVLTQNLTEMIEEKTGEDYFVYIDFIAGVKFDIEVFHRRTKERKIYHMLGGDVFNDSDDEEAVGIIAEIIKLWNKKDIKVGE